MRSTEAVPVRFAAFVVFTLATVFFVSGLVQWDWLDFLLASAFFFTAAGLFAYLRQEGRS